MFTIRTAALVTVATVALVVGPGIAQPPKPPGVSDSLPIPPESEAMKGKLKNAHAVLDALALADYESLRLNADVLKHIAEMRVFVTAHRSEEYKFQAQAFKIAADDLMKAARARNLEAATLAYNDMTRTCVKCHATFRPTPK